MTAIIRAYHGVSFEPLGEWTGCTAVSIAYDENGPASADITLPRNSMHLRAKNIAPGGIGVILEIDARDIGADASSRAIGIPDVWLGRASTVSASSQGGTCTVGCVGPSSWLDKMTIARQSTRESAGAIAKRLLEQYPGGRVSAGAMYYGPGGDAALGGGSLWSVLSGLANDRGETFTLTAVPGQARLVLNWKHPLQSDDRTGSVTLIEGTNAEWDTTYQLDMTVPELLGVAESFEAGPGAVAASVSAPAGARFGRHSALTAVLSSSAARATIEGGESIIRPDIPTRAELELVLGARLRELLVPSLLLQVTVTDPALWRHLSPGILVGVDVVDPLWVYNGGAVGRVLDRAFDLMPALGCTIGLELWRTADE